MEKKKFLEAENNGELTKVRVTDQDIQDFEDRLSELDPDRMIEAGDVVLNMIEDKSNTSTNNKMLLIRDKLTAEKPKLKPKRKDLLF